jgi:protein tyrosine/serine phosphatase
VVRKALICLMVGVALPNVPAGAASVPGIKNFDRVDGEVYRGGQPTAEGFRYLAKLGVKTIIDLRGSGRRSKVERRLVRADGMNYINIPLTKFAPPTRAEISDVLGILEDSNAEPVFVHCRRGVGRTGAAIAAYHIDHDKWDNARALKDAMEYTRSHAIPASKRSGVPRPLRNLQN